MANPSHAMMDVLHSFCSASRQLAELQQKTKDELREIRDVRKAANALLLELLTEEEMVARLPEGCFSVRVKVQHKRPAQGVAVLQKMEEFWQSDGLDDWRRRVAEEPELDPIDSFIEAVLDCAWPAAVQKRTLEIRKVKESSARVQDLPEAPLQNAPLLSSIVDAKKVMADRLVLVREDKKKLQERCKEAEQKILPELAQLPEGYIRRVDLKDANGADEAFYMRLKPARKRPPKKFSCQKLGGAMKSLLEERAPSTGRQALVDRLSSPRFGATLCQDLAAALTSAAEPLSQPRVALDRLREVPAGRGC